jgi:hypothetical protein
MDSQVGTGEQIQAEAEAIPKSDSKYPQDTPALRRNWGKTNVPTVVRKDNGRMNVPSKLESPKSPPRLKAEARWLRKGTSPPAGEPAHGRKILSVWQAWNAMRKTRIDWTPSY